MEITENTKPDNTEQEVIKSPVIGEEQLLKANATLEKYKNGKKNLEARHIANEQWWKLRQWEQINQNADDQSGKPASGWLFNCIISKHADYDEAYPTFNCLPSEQGDKEEAQNLSSIIPVVLEQNHFRDTYSDCGWQKFKFGTAVYGIFWDPDKYNGLGDITIEKVDSLSIFFEPGITDIQKSKNIFRTQLVDNEIIAQRYPDTVGRLGGSVATMNRYRYDDTVDTDNKSLVIDWYYHKYVNGKKTLQYCRYVNNIVLYATENDENLAERGLYDHAMFPFVLDPLFPVEGSPFGFGYIDVCKSPQMFIDRLGSAILDNAEFGARPKYMSTGDVNEKEVADPSKMFVHVEGSISEQSLRRMEVPELSSLTVQVRNNLIDEMKETSGNRDVSNGGSVSGVTAASAIAAMQEQSGKTSRDSTQNSYRAYEKIINMVIELIRQFYDTPRQFRITGNYGAEEFVSYSNAGIKPQQQGSAFGMDMGYRLPVFDLEVKSEKNNAYTKISQNELALQFYQLGFFNPQNADMAVMTLDMMDFEGKQSLLDKISKNGMMYQQLLQTQQLCLELCKRLDASEGTNMTEQFSQAIIGNAEQMQTGTTASADLETGTGTESKTVSDARAQAQASTQPR